MLSKIHSGLWNQRKILLILALTSGVLELIFYFPAQLLVWVGVLGVIQILAVWWLTGFYKQYHTFRWLAVELIWMMFSGVGVIVFTLLSSVQFQIAMVVLVCVQASMLWFYDQYLTHGHWPVRAFAVLDLYSLLTFFMWAVTVLHAADLYSLPVWMLMVFGVAQTFVLMFARFAREEILGARRWFYSWLISLILVQVIWVTSFWYRGAYMKGFLVSILFYLLADFVIHYQKRTLTVKVALEYVGLALAVLVMMVIFDSFFVLR